LHVDDPKVKEAAIEANVYLTAAYKEGFVPPSALNWNDADDNNAFHAKTIVMDIDGTISTEVAIFKKKEEYDDIVTMGLPLSNDGKPVPSMTFPGNAVIPQGAKNIAVAKDFLKYFIQPEVNNEWLKTGLGRNTPVMPSIVKNDSWWFADPHRAAYTQQGRARANRAAILGFKSGPCPGSDRACLVHRLDGHHPGRGDAGGGDRKVVEAGRGDLREIPDRADLSTISRRVSVDDEPGHLRSRLRGGGGEERLSAARRRSIVDGSERLLGCAA
jgi:hypothetical protein